MMLKFNDNLHTIWMPTSNELRLSDQIINNLITWQDTLPKEWHVILWTDTKKVKKEYLAYLQEKGIVILDVDIVIQKAPKDIAAKLKLLAQDSPDAYTKILFSHIFRMLVLTATDYEYAGGVYLDVAKFEFSAKLIKSTKKYICKLKYGFYFNYSWQRPSKIHLNSNVSFCADYNTLPDESKKVFSFYFAELSILTCNDIEAVMNKKLNLNMIAIHTNIPSLFKFREGENVCLADGKDVFNSCEISGNFDNFVPDENSSTTPSFETDVSNKDPELSLLEDLGLKLNVEYTEDILSAVNKRKYFSYGDMVDTFSRGLMKGPSEMQIKRIYSKIMQLHGNEKATNDEMEKQVSSLNNAILVSYRLLNQQPENNATNEEAKSGLWLSGSRNTF